MKTRAIFLIVLLAASTASAQIPDQFSNLKVMPQDIGKAELLDTMKNFTFALGLRCDDCHVQKVPGDFSSFDWANDEKDAKEIARSMMKLVADLNAKLPQATGDEDAAVSCVTCHRGLANPRTLDHVLLQVAGTEGIEAAAARYGELREKYYGAGAYDFSPRTLDTVASELAAGADLAGARRMAELNLEMNPDHTMSMLILAQVALAGGDKDEAGRQIEAVLALEPQNRGALRMKQQLGQ